jgi:alpha,alpha-trehalase
LLDETIKQEEVIVGTYHLSNLLQELVRAKRKLHPTFEKLSRIQENPVHRISRKIRDDYWEELTYEPIKKGLTQIIEDEKRPVM